MNEITLQQKIDTLTALINSEVSEFEEYLAFLDCVDSKDEDISEVRERSKQRYAVLLSILKDYAPDMWLKFSDDFEIEVDIMRQENE